MPAFSADIGPTLDALRDAGESMREHLAGANLSGQTLHTLETALEEIITNTIKYGFASTAAPRIRAEVDLTPEGVELRIADNGAAFDPTQAPAPAPAESIEAMPVGGLGLHLVRQMAREFRYERRGDWNHVTIRA